MILLNPVKDNLEHVPRNLPRYRHPRILEHSEVVDAAESDNTLFSAHGANILWRGLWLEAPSPSSVDGLTFLPWAWSEPSDICFFAGR